MYNRSVNRNNFINFVCFIMVSDGIIFSLYELLINVELVNGVNNFVFVCLFFDLIIYF